MNSCFFRRTSIFAPIFEPTFLRQFLAPIFNFLMELELKLEWLEGVSKNLGGASPPDFSDTPSSHSNFNSNSIKKLEIGPQKLEQKSWSKNWRGNQRLSEKTEVDYLDPPLLPI